MFSTFAVVDPDFHRMICLEKSSNREVKSESRNYIASFTKADFSPHISPVEEPRRISKMVLQLESFRPEIVNAQSKYKLRRVC